MNQLLKRQHGNLGYRSGCTAKPWLGTKFRKLIKVIKVMVRWFEPKIVAKGTSHSNVC